jgi:DNA-binding MarR family transcriptional regulator
LKYISQEIPMGKNLDDAADILLSLHPHYFRKFIYGTEISARDMARYKILGIAEIAGPLPISEIGKRLFISRPYMTRLIDSLIAEGLIERQYNIEDRRVINITITAAGRRYFREGRDRLKVRMREILSALPDDDVRELSAALSRVRQILQKLADDRQDPGLSGPGHDNKVQE